MTISKKLIQLDIFNFKKFPSPLASFQKTNNNICLLLCKSKCYAKKAQRTVESLNSL